MAKQMSGSASSDGLKEKQCAASRPIGTGRLVIFFTVQSSCLLLPAFSLKANQWPPYSCSCHGPHSNWASNHVDWAQRKGRWVVGRLGHGKTVFRFSPWEISWCVHCTTQDIAPLGSVLYSISSALKPHHPSSFPEFAACWPVATLHFPVGRLNYPTGDKQKWQRCLPPSFQVDDTTSNIISRQLAPFSKTYHWQFSLFTIHIS